MSISGLEFGIFFFVILSVILSISVSGLALWMLELLTPYYKCHEEWRESREKRVGLFDVQYAMWYMYGALVQQGRPQVVKDCLPSNTPDKRKIANPLPCTIDNSDDPLGDPGEGVVGGC